MNTPSFFGKKPPALIKTMHHEWYMQQSLRGKNHVLSYDSGNVGGLHLINPALANKPTQSTIGTKISYAADGVDDYLYKATTNFMRSMPTWMVTVVFKYDSSNNNRFLIAWNGANIVNEGVSFFYNTTYNALHTQSFTNTGSAYNYLSNTQPLVNGQNYIVNFGWNGTNVVFYLETTNIGSVAAPNPILQTSSTNNISTTSRIRTSNPSGNIYEVGNIGYIGVDEFDLTRLNNNVASLKSTFGI